MVMLWWSLIVLMLALGFLGCFINKVPGPVFVVIAAILAQACLKIPIGWDIIAIVAVLAIGSIFASKFLVKKVKSLQEFSKRASWGTTIGSILGLIVMSAASNGMSTAVAITLFIVALIVIPFIFAFLLELTNKQGAPQALKCATAATGAYAADTFLKLLVLYYSILIIFQI